MTQQIRQTQFPPRYIQYLHHEILYLEMRKKDTIGHRGAVLRRSVRSSNRDSGILGWDKSWVQPASGASRHARTFCMFAA